MTKWVPKAGPALMSRRRLHAVLAGGVAGAACFRTASADTLVNAPKHYGWVASTHALECAVDLDDGNGTIDRRVFGSNLEWFNDGGGLASGDAELRARLVQLARSQQVSVFRYPGGTLADFYHWRDGIGPVDKRPVRKHPTDPGRSANNFGSPEFFDFLKQTGAEGLITVNVGTGTAQEAAGWVAYANQPGNAERKADGFPEPIGIKLWEVGNEVYLPGNPGEQIITQKPEVYAAHFLDYADAIRKVDPSVTVIAIGVAKSQIGPSTQFPDWTEKVLAAAGPKIDMIAVHNAYFPILYNIKQPTIEQVYPSLWASPESVARSLTDLDALIARYERGRKIQVAITEWGALFSLPTVDPFWFDHVKTMGSAVYLARLMQVFLAQPRVSLANYFKLTDRSFMGWIGFDGQPKLPYTVFKLFSTLTGTTRLKATLASPTFDTQDIGQVPGEKNVAEVTAFASTSEGGKIVSISFVNRSLKTIHRIRPKLKKDGQAIMLKGTLNILSTPEPTSHNGNDAPPELKMSRQYDPYSTVKSGSIKVKTQSFNGTEFSLPPYSVAILVLVSAGS